jgi:metal-sulfur cluster biosynthetic enzyme
MSDYQEPSQGPTTASVESVRVALRQVKDPELGFNIVDLGLVYTIDITGGDVLVEMTLTSPGCPVGGQLLGEADAVVREVDGVKNVRVELVWEPFWTPERIDPKVRAYLGF